MMNLIYDPALMEEVVLQEVRTREARGETDLYESYHKAADSIYEKYSLRSRRTAFQKLHGELFMRLGYGRFLSDAVRQFTEITEKVEGVMFGGAATPQEERADYAPERKWAGVKIRPERFQDLFRLEAFLQHELMHLSDMLSEKFQYLCESRLQGLSQNAERMARFRYGVIWDIYIDGRLSRVGHRILTSKDERLRELKEAMPSSPPSALERLFRRIWEADALTHSEILAIAVDPHRALVVSDSRAVRGGGVPGFLCPLCNFPTHAWSRDLDRLEERIASQMMGDMPGWRPEDGACERCVEGYLARAGCWR